MSRYGISEGLLPLNHTCIPQAVHKMNSLPASSNRFYDCQRTQENVFLLLLFLPLLDVANKLDTFYIKGLQEELIDWLGNIQAGFIYSISMHGSIHSLEFDTECSFL